MARLDSRRTRKLKNLARGFTRAHETASTAKSVVRNPVGHVGGKVLERIKTYGDSPRRRGPIRERVQHYNPRTQSFVKRDTRTGKILGTKKRKPFRNVRLK